MKKSISKTPSFCFKTNTLFSSINAICQNKRIQTKKILVLSAALSLAACSSSEQPSYNKQSAAPVVEAQSSSAAKTTVKRMVSGSVVGDDIANKTLNLVWSDGAVNNIATTDATGRYQVSLPQNVELPVILEVNEANAQSGLKVLISSLDKEAELSPVSTVAVEKLVGQYTKGQGVAALNNLSDQDLSSSIQTVISQVFGHGLTASDLKGSADVSRVLMAALQNLDTNKSLVDILRSATNDKDTSVEGNLLSNSAFQTLLAGVFTSKNFSSNDVMSLLSSTGIDSNIVEKAAKNAVSFEEVKQLAKDNNVNTDVVNTIVEAASKAASDVLGNAKPDDLNDLLGKVLETVSPALVDMVSQTLPSDMKKEQVSEVVKTAADQAGKILNEQAGGEVKNLSEGQLSTIKDQLGDVAKLVGGPVAEVLSGTVLNNLSKEQTATVVDTIGANLGNIAGAFIDQLGQGALPQEALAKATLASAPVAETIGKMLVEETVKNATPDTVANLIKTVGKVSLDQLNKGDSNTTDANTMADMLNVVAGALTGANLDTNKAVEQATSNDQSKAVVDTLAQAASTLIEMTQQGSVDTEDTASGANLIKNVVNAVLPAITANTATAQPSATDSNAAETSSEEPAAPVATSPSPTTPAPFTLVVDGKETTVVDAIANAAQNALINFGQQAFGSLFGQNTSES